MTFINKMDRETRDPLDLLDEIEQVLNIRCAPVTWPIGRGKGFKGIYHLAKDKVILCHDKNNETGGEFAVYSSLDHPELPDLLGEALTECQEELELILGASEPFDQAAYLAGEQTGVYFGSAINNFGVRELLTDFTRYAPGPQSRQANEREVLPEEKKFTGFVFKIQANMDPQHRDRIAFMRLTSGQYKKGMKMRHIRLGKDIQVSNALTFMAGQREHLDTAYPGDIIGLHNHGTIQIGDTFSQGEVLKFTGIPNFAPELFKLVRLKDPLRQKALLKGLIQLSEEGATQLFRPVHNNDLILGAVGALQFDVVAYRLLNEYKVSCIYELVSVAVARWVECDDSEVLENFKREQQRNLAIDGSGHLTYLAPSRVSLEITMEQWPAIGFRATREV